MGNLFHTAPVESGAVFLLRRSDYDWRLIRTGSRDSERIWRPLEFGDRVTDWWNMIGRYRLGLFGVALALVTGLASTVAIESLAKEPAEMTPTTREEARRVHEEGNFAEALERYKKLLDSDAQGPELAEDLRRAIECLMRLTRVTEFDALVESTVKRHPDDPYVLQAAAIAYQNAPHMGSWIDGEFERGGYRGRRGIEATFIETSSYDRVRSVQLMLQVQEHLDKFENDKQRAQAFFLLANLIDMGRSYGEAWRLQEKTDFTQLPKLEPSEHQNYWGWRMGNPGTPVDEAGEPVLYDIPESYDAAKNDGERWRWALAQAKALDAEIGRQADLLFGDFLQFQFGVQTLSGWIGLSRIVGQTREDGKPLEPGPYAVHTLTDDESIVKLATGVKRIPLKKGFNHIALFKSLAEGKDTYAEQALERLVGIYENRRQFPRAAEQLRDLIDRFGPGGEDEPRRNRLDQIVGNWGQLGPVTNQVAGEAATIRLRYRNAKHVMFTAKEIRYERLIEDALGSVQSGPRDLDHWKIELNELGHRLVVLDQEKYVGEQVASWTTDLDPLPEHFDRQQVMETPLKKAGVYLLTAQMQDGNTDHIILWLTDTAIARMATDQGPLYYVSDAKTGKPVPGADLQIMAWESDRRGNRGDLVYTIKRFEERTDKNGMVQIEHRDEQRPLMWLAVARTADGRLAHLGFDHFGYRERSRHQFDRGKVYAITDRPVYRPGQLVKMKAWFRQVGYDIGDDEAVLDDEFIGVTIQNPRGDVVLTDAQLRTDERGGVSLEYALPEEAMLGRYQVQWNMHNRIRGSVSFRVEEYKKPEFEVTVDAPSEPVMLGETIKAKVQAKYYFGSPVTNATVHYKVTRTVTRATWYPSGPWDWFYGSGYWWFASSYDWYPGFARWGCFPPTPDWWPHSSDPPEIVAENEVPIGEDGTVEIAIDTAIAKELFGDQDHKYEITAEVIDASRRVITGSGSVSAPREPFQVTAWVNRGFFEAGDTVDAHFKAQTIDHKPISGKATTTLYRVSYDAEGTPSEKQVEQWTGQTDEQGALTQRFEAAQPGQYRIATVVADGKGHSQEGGYLLTVLPKEIEQAESADYRFNGLELIADDREYRPGDTARLMVAAAQPDATVLVFVRPEAGQYPKPQVIHLDGKAQVIEIPIEKGDMPNLFVEAFTVGAGEVHNVVRELHVPPEQRVVNVEVQPSATEYKPGEEALIDVKLTDLEGKPVQGEVVLTMYDRSLEYISGGANVGDIREFFWKWTRNHRPRVAHNLNRRSGHIVPHETLVMNFIGIFGHLLTPEASDRKSVARQEGSGLNEWGLAADHFGMGMPSRGAGGMGGMGGAMLRRGGEVMSAAPAAAPMAEAAADSMHFAQDKQLAGQELVEATVRSDFADAAYWEAGKMANEEGLVTLRFKMPENLTDWKIRSWAMGPQTRVGEGAASAVTRKNLLVRLQAPRFFTETDEVVLSANVHNYLSSAKQARVTLKLDGDTLAFQDEATRTVDIPANGEARVDWRVKAIAPGEATITMEALTDEESDAMRQNFPVQIHGMLRTESFAGTIRPGETENAVAVSIPEKRREKDSQIEVRFSPSLAAAMVDALPYLVDYPYGCTEQTLNRFLPTVITQRVLQKMDLNLADIQEKKTNLNAQELGDPEERRVERWSKNRRSDAKNPVWDPEEVTKMSNEGIQRLLSFQREDGGWSWFPGADRANPHMTAIIVHGLKVAEQNRLVLPPEMLQRGVAWLNNYQNEEVQKLANGERDEKVDPYKTVASDIDALVYRVLVENGRHDQRMEGYLYRDRLKLSAYSLVLFGLALEQTKSADRLAMVVRNLSQYLVVDDENDTAYLRVNEGFWWFWYGSDIETNATYLRLLCRTDPKSEVSPQLVKFLLNNRRNGTYWNSTRDTAVVVEAFAEYLDTTGELNPEMLVEVRYDGKVLHEVKISRENLFTFDNALTIDADAISSGDHKLTLHKQGAGSLYWNAYVTNFTQEDFIKAAGLEVKVDRNFYLLTRREDATASFRGSRGQATTGKIEEYDRKPLESGAKLASGDLVEIELVVESKNDYEYLAFEDMKAAGFEPVEVQSGYSGNGLGAYMELRDERVAFFVERLPLGKHNIRYRMRAEIPGTFSALPTKGYGMYAPELKANSDEWKVSITDVDPPAGVKTEGAENAESE